MRKENINNLTLSSAYWDIVLADNYVSFDNYETFPQLLTRYLMDAKFILHMNQRRISELTGIESTTITKYKNNKRKPTLTAIILLSLAMRLTPDRSSRLLYTAGFQLNDCPEHRIYKLFLQGCAFNTEYNIENCNQLLLEKGFIKLRS